MNKEMSTKGPWADVCICKIGIPIVKKKPGRFQLKSSCRGHRPVCNVKVLHPDVERYVGTIVMAQV